MSLDDWRELAKITFEELGTGTIVLFTIAGLLIFALAARLYFAYYWTPAP